MKGLIKTGALARVRGIEEIITHQHLCTEACLAVVMQYYKSGFAYPFCECFSFSFQKGQGKLSDGLDTGTGLFESYAKHGRLLKKTFVDCWSEYSLYLKESLIKGNPVIVHYDCYYLKWDPCYRKKHNEHVLIVDGFEGDNFHLVDPYFCESGIVNKRLLECASAFYFCLEPLKNNEEEDYEKILNEKFAEWKKNGYFKNAEGLAMAIENINPVSEFFEANNMDVFYNSELMTKLLRIRTNKYRFCMFLKEWEEATGQGAYSERFRKVLSYWDMLRIGFIKAFYRRFSKDMLKQAADCLRKAVVEEYEFTKSVFQGKNEYVFSGESEAVEGKKFLFDLLPYCNNKGLTKTPGDEKTDCTGLGEYICASEERANWEKFGYCLLVGEKVDNVQCVGQTICFPEGIIEIKMLLTAEWGAFDVSFLVKDDCGIKIYYPVRVEDWAEFNEIDFGKMYKRHEGTDELFREHCYAGEAILPVKNGCRELILPDCPNVHILSIIYVKKIEKSDSRN